MVVEEQQATVSETGDNIQKRWLQKTLRSLKIMIKFVL